MHLLIRKADGAVVGTNYLIAPLVDERYEVKEWHGPEPPIHDLDAELPVYSYDPTPADPDYPAFLQTRIDFDALVEKATAEIEWLDETIPDIPTMTGAEVRNVVHRIAREQRMEIKAWRYIFRRLI